MIDGDLARKPRALDQCKIKSAARIAASKSAYRQMAIDPAREVLIPLSNMRHTEGEGITDKGNRRRNRLFLPVKRANPTSSDNRHDEGNHLPVRDHGYRIRRPNTQPRARVRSYKTSLAAAAARKRRTPRLGEHVSLLTTYRGSVDLGMRICQTHSIVSIDQRNFIIQKKGDCSRQESVKGFDVTLQSTEMA